MRIFKAPDLNFIGNRNKAYMFSGALLLLTLGSLIYHPMRSGVGPNLSIDFLGGTVIQVRFEKPILGDMSRLRSIVVGLGLGNPEVKTIGAKDDNEIQIIVKTSESEGAAGETVTAALAKEFADNPFEVRRQEKVGPKIGGELQEKAVIAVLLSLVAIIVYVGFRFHLPYGIAAVVALFHDVLITLGVFSVLNMEVSLPIVAALLTIVGYSLNDTIVVFDRIRENLGGAASKASFEDRVNLSINQTLSRTIITSFTTFIVVVVIYALFFGTRDVVEYFAFALIVGIVIGTYSSVFIASPVLVLWNKKWPIK